MKKILIIILFFIILVAIFFPKFCGTSYGGFVKTGTTMHRKECTCLGFKYSTHGDIFGLQNCVDCGKTYFCAGIPIDTKCYEWVFNGSQDFSTEKEITCFY